MLTGKNVRQFVESIKCTTERVCGTYSNEYDLIGRRSRKFVGASALKCAAGLQTGKLNFKKSRELQFCSVVQDAHTMQMHEYHIGC